MTQNRLQIVRYHYRKHSTMHSNEGYTLEVIFNDGSEITFSKIIAVIHSAGDYTVQYKEPWQSTHEVKNFIRITTSLGHVIESNGNANLLNTMVTKSKESMRQIKALNTQKRLLTLGATKKVKDPDLNKVLYKFYNIILGIQHYRPV